jgi:hypothetical protein
MLRPLTADGADDLIVVKGGGRIHQRRMTVSAQFSLGLGRNIFLHMIRQLDNGVSL